MTYRKLFSTIVIIPLILGILASVSFSDDEKDGQPAEPHERAAAPPDEESAALPNQADSTPKTALRPLTDDISVRGMMLINHEWFKGNKFSPEFLKWARAVCSGTHRKYFKKDKYFYPVEQLNQDFLTKVTVLHSRGSPSLVGDQSLNKYFKRMIQHLCLDQLKDRKRLGRSIEEYAKRLADRNGGKETPLSLAIQKEELALQKKKMEELHRAISLLSNKLRQTLILHLEGLKGPEIAERLGIPLSTVGTRLYTARLELAKDENLAKIALVLEIKSSEIKHPDQKKTKEEIEKDVARLNGRRKHFYKSQKTGYESGMRIEFPEPVALITGLHFISDDEKDPKKNPFLEEHADAEALTVLRENRLTGEYEIRLYFRNRGHSEWPMAYSEAVNEEIRHAEQISKHPKERMREINEKEIEKLETAVKKAREEIKKENYRPCEPATLEEAKHAQKVISELIAGKKPELLHPSTRSVFGLKIAVRDEKEKIVGYKSFYLYTQAERDGPPPFAVKEGKNHKRYLSVRTMILNRVSDAFLAPEDIHGIYKEPDDYMSARHYLSQIRLERKMNPESAKKMDEILIELNTRVTSLNRTRMEFIAKGEQASEQEYQQARKKIAEEAKAIAKLDKEVKELYKKCHGRDRVSPVPWRNLIQEAIPDKNAPQPPHPITTRNNFTAEIVEALYLSEPTPDEIRDIIVFYKYSPISKEMFSETALELMKGAAIYFKKIYDFTDLFKNEPFHGALLTKAISSTSEVFAFKIAYFVSIQQDLFYKEDISLKDIRQLMSCAYHEKTKHPDLHLDLADLVFRKGLTLVHTAEDFLNLLNATDVRSNLSDHSDESSYQFLARGHDLAIEKQVYRFFELDPTAEQMERFHKFADTKERFPIQKALIQERFSRAKNYEEFTRIVYPTIDAIGDHSNRLFSDFYILAAEGVIERDLNLILSKKLTIDNISDLLRNFHFSRSAEEALLERGIEIAQPGNNALYKLFSLEFRTHSLGSLYVDERRTRLEVNGNRDKLPAQGIRERCELRNELILKHLDHFLSKVTNMSEIRLIVALPVFTKKTREAIFERALKYIDNAEDYNKLKLPQEKSKHCKEVVRRFEQEDLPLKEFTRIVPTARTQTHKLVIFEQGRQVELEGVIRELQYDRKDHRAVGVMVVERIEKIDKVTLAYEIFWDWREQRFKGLKPALDPKTNQSINTEAFLTKWRKDREEAEEQAKAEASAPPKEAPNLFSSLWDSFAGLFRSSDGAPQPNPTDPTLTNSVEREATPPLDKATELKEGGAELLNSVVKEGDKGSLSPIRSAPVKKRVVVSPDPESARVDEAPSEATPANPAPAPLAPLAPLTRRASLKEEPAAAMRAPIKEVPTSAGAAVRAPIARATTPPAKARARQGGAARAKEADGGLLDATLFLDPIILRGSDADFEALLVHLRRTASRDDLPFLDQLRKQTSDPKILARIGEARTVVLLHRRVREGQTSFAPRAAALQAQDDRTEGSFGLRPQDDKGVQNDILDHSFAGSFVKFSGAVALKEAMKEFLTGKKGNYSHLFGDEQFVGYGAFGATTALGTALSGSFANAIADRTGRSAFSSRASLVSPYKLGTYALFMTLGMQADQIARLWLTGIKEHKDVATALNDAFGIWWQAFHGDEAALTTAGFIAAKPVVSKFSKVIRSHLVERLRNLQKNIRWGHKLLSGAERLSGGGIVVSIVEEAIVLLTVDMLMEEYISWKKESDLKEKIGKIFIDLEKLSDTIAKDNAIEHTEKMAAYFSDLRAIRTAYVHLEKEEVAKKYQVFQKAIGDLLDHKSGMFWRDAKAIYAADQVRDSQEIRVCKELFDETQKEGPLRLAPDSWGKGGDSFYRNYLCDHLAFLKIWTKKLEEIKKSHYDYQLAYAKSENRKYNKYAFTPDFLKEIDLKNLSHVFNIESANQRDIYQLEQAYYKVVLDKVTKKVSSGVLKNSSSQSHSWQRPRDLDGDSPNLLGTTSLGDRTAYSLPLTDADMEELSPIFDACKGVRETSEASEVVFETSHEKIESSTERSFALQAAALRAQDDIRDFKIDPLPLLSEILKEDKFWIELVSESRNEEGIYSTYNPNRLHIMNEVNCLVAEGLMISDDVISLEGTEDKPWMKCSEMAQRPFTQDEEQKRKWLGLFIHTFFETTIQ